MDGLQGAILRIKLRHLDRWNARRRQIADIYRELLPVSGVRPISVPRDSSPIYHQFVVRTSQRYSLREALNAEGIQTGIHYPIPLHRQPAFQPYVFTETEPSLPNTDMAAGEILSLPMYPELSDDAVARVATWIARSMGRLAVRAA
jgi:dTDP-4-amino-4,6-dideoxygalactose transaminase